MSNQEPKPCSFCQQDLEWCTDLCGFIHPTESFCVVAGLLIDKSDVDRWNKRNPDPRIEELTEALDKACRSVTELIGFSHGVDGLHMNGDVAPWEDLRSGGRYEGWLIEFDEALETLRKYAQEEEGDE